MKFRVASIKGDGIGPEIVTQAQKVLNAVASAYGHEFEFVELLDHGHGDDDLVVLKRIERLCAVENDVRIKHIRFFHSRNPFF